MINSCVDAQDDDAEKGRETVKNTESPYKRGPVGSNTNDEEAGSLSKVELLATTAKTDKAAEIAKEVDPELAAITEIAKTLDEDESDDMDDLEELALLAFAEFISSYLLIIVTMGAELAMGNYDVLGVGFVNGLGEMAIIFACSNLKADFNPAVTISFYITGNCDGLHAIIKMIFSCIGGIAGGTTLTCMFSKKTDMTKHFACLHIQDDFPYHSAFITEAICTFMIIFVIFQTAADACEKAEGALLAQTLSSPIAVGFVIVVGVIITLPVTGGGLNPMRALATAIPGAYRQDPDYVWDNFELFIFAPMVGGIMVGVFQKYFMLPVRDRYKYVDFLSKHSLTDNMIKTGSAIKRASSFTAPWKKHKH